MADRTSSSGSFWISVVAVLFFTRLRSPNFSLVKRMAVSLGMPFPDACAGDWGTLMTYIGNSKTKPDPSLIL